MKKIMPFMVFFTVFSFLFTTCLFHLPVSTGERKIGSESQREYLALIKAKGGPRISTEDELKIMAQAILTPLDNYRSPSVSETAITGTIKLPIGGYAVVPGRAIEPGVSPVEVYAFTTENGITGEQGFILACNDNRMGNILAVIDSGVPNNPDEPFLKFLYSQVENHFKSTILIYDSITDEDVEVAKKARNITPDSGSGIWTGFPESGFLLSDDVVEAAWFWNEGYYSNTIAEWGQGSLYNKYILELVDDLQDIDEDSNCVGSETVAIAHIMAHFGWPELYNEDDSLDYTPDPGLEQYDWQNMNSKETIYCFDPNDPAVDQIALLMYEIGQRLQYQYDSRFNFVAGIENIMNVFYEMGYTTAVDFNDYDYTTFSKIRTSIMNGSPVMVYATTSNGNSHGPNYWHFAHAFVIDGVRNMMYQEKDSTGQTSSIGLGSLIQFVRCNMGFGQTGPLDDNGDEIQKKYNGWYRSSLLETQSLDLSKLTFISYARNFVGYAEWETGIFNKSIIYLDGIYPDN